MSKFYFECTICKGVKDAVVRYITDTKIIFTPDFKKQAYNLHFYCSIVLTYLSMMLLTKYAHLEDTGIFFHLFIGGFGAYCVNFLKEWVWSKYYGSPWDDTDINMGSYGGILGAILFLIL
jgi:hypothetical protein